MEGATGCKSAAVNGAPEIAGVAVTAGVEGAADALDDWGVGDEFLIGTGL